jgi:hypothetical protein
LTGTIPPHRVSTTNNERDPTTTDISTPSTVPVPPITPRQGMSVPPAMIRKWTSDRDRTGEDNATCLNDVLRLVGVADIEGLRSAVALYLDEVDAWLDLRDEPTTLIVCVGQSGTGLEYPFAIQELWATLDELEAEYFTEERG